MHRLSPHGSTGASGRETAARDGTAEIPASEVRASALSVADTGRVFWWRGRLFRAIAAAQAAEVRRLFDCGLVAELVERGLLVRSWIAPLSLEGYGLVVEHEVIDVPVYPREWTFSMLQDAALLVLDVNEAAARHGYQTKDCHGYNVLFRASRPVFVDLGSFMRVEAANGVLYAFHEFMRSYVYPLQVWRTAGQYLGTRAVPRVGSIMPAAAYFKYRWPALRRMKDSTLTLLVQRWHALATLRYRRVGDLAGRFPPWVIGALGWLRRHDILSGPARIEKLRRTTASLRPPSAATAWSGYQDELDPSGSAGLSPRFARIVAKVQDLAVDSVMEIAGNQGALCRQLAASGRLKRVVCTDSDAYALDKGYRAARRDGLGVTWAILDPFSHETGQLEIAPQERFRADAVIALALTHHLVLTQNLPLAHVLDVFAQYARRYVLVEFMPAGLHDGMAAPALPGWYTEDWFRAEFGQRFEILERAQLEPNRVLYVGRLR